MIKVNIESGVCGFNTITAKLSIESNCPHVTKIVHNLGEFNAMDELFKKGQSKILTLCQENLPHITCLVPIGLLKALEVSTGLALPKEANISFIK